VRLFASPGGAIPPGQVATYRLVVRNSGRADATQVRVTLPFAQDTQTLLNTTFSGPGAWVSAVQTGTVELHLASLKREQTLTTTLRLATDAAAQFGRSLATRAQVRWNNSDIRFSNRISPVVARAAAAALPARLLVSPPSGSPSTTFDISYDGFTSREQVSLWYQQPDGSQIGVGQIQADLQGRIVYHLSATALAAGQYRFVMFGQFSQVSAVGTFTISQS
jgi:uncharacterized repeat protein (TIGR01451 family)